MRSIDENGRPSDLSWRTTRRFNFCLPTFFCAHGAEQRQHAIRYAMPCYAAGSTCPCRRLRAG